MQEPQNHYFLIFMFYKIEDRLQKRDLERAQQEARTLLEREPQNLYARAIEKRLSRIIELRKNSHGLFRYRCASVKRKIKALRHLCRIVVDKMLKYGADAEK
jgi:hypothetical protein